MKSCPRCGRDLDKTGHSLSCPIGQVVKQIDEGKSKNKENEAVRIAFPDEETRQQFQDMMARTALQMVATKTFIDSVTELDEDAPNLTHQIAPILEKFIMDLTMIYPTPSHFDVDLKILLGQKE